MKNKVVEQLIENEGSNLPTLIKDAFAQIPPTNSKEKTKEIKKLFEEVNRHYHAAANILKDYPYQVKNIGDKLAKYVMFSERTSQDLTEIIEKFRHYEDLNNRMERQKKEKAVQEKAEEAAKIAKIAKQAKLEELAEKYKVLSTFTKDPDEYLEDEKETSVIDEVDAEAYSKYVTAGKVEEIENLLQTIEQRKSDRKRLKKEAETLARAFGKPTNEATVASKFGKRKDYNVFTLKHRENVEGIIAIYEKRKVAWETEVETRLMNLTENYVELFPGKDLSEVKESVKNAVKKLSKKEVNEILDPLEKEVAKKREEIEAEKVRVRELRNEVSDLKEKIDAQLNNITNYVSAPLYTIQCDVSELRQLPELKNDLALIQLQADLKNLYEQINARSQKLQNTASIAYGNGTMPGNGSAEIEVSILELKAVLENFTNNDETPTFNDTVNKDLDKAQKSYDKCVKDIGEKLQGILITRKAAAVSSVDQFKEDLKAQEVVVLRVSNELKNLGNSPVQRVRESALRENIELTAWEPVHIAGTKVKVSECDTALKLIEVSQIAPTSKEGICEVSGKLKELAKTEATLDGVKKTIDANKDHLAPKVEANKALCFKAIATIAEIILDKTNKRIEKYNGKFGINIGKTKKKVKLATEFNEVITKLRRDATSKSEDNILQASDVIRQKMEDYKGVASQLIGFGLMNRNRFTDNDQGYFAIVESNLEALDKQIETLSNLKLGG